MFGKKKPQKLTPDQTAFTQALIVDIPLTVYALNVGNKPGHSLVADIEFDDRHRVSKFKDLKIDGELKVPNPATFEQISKLTQPLNDFPEIGHLKGMHFEVSEDSQLSANFDYKISD